MENEKITDENGMFNAKTEIKVLKALNTLLLKASEPIDHDTALNNGHLSTLDPANVSLIVAKTRASKATLWGFVDKNKEQRVPSLDYSISVGQGAKYSIDYMSKIVKLLTASGEGFTIKTLKDFPATFENDHFIVILAPRVEN